MTGDGPLLFCSIKLTLSTLYLQHVDDHHTISTTCRLQVSIPDDVHNVESKNQILDEMHLLLMHLRRFGFYDY